MKLIVGLGNPGNEYKNTRHNIGFICLDHYLISNNLDEMKEKFNGLYLKTTINQESVIFLKPLSYMNLSGTVVRKFVDYFQVSTEDILVIQDDIDMPIGKIKLKEKSSCGGHNGVRNIIDELKTENIKRIKIGISKKDNIEIKNYVLGKFTQDELAIINNLCNITDNIINDYLNHDFPYLMNKYNGVYYETN